MAGVEQVDVRAVAPVQELDPVVITHCVARFQRPVHRAGCRAPRGPHLVRVNRVVVCSERLLLAGLVVIASIIPLVPLPEADLAVGHAGQYVPAVVRVDRHADAVAVVLPDPVPSLSPLLVSVSMLVVTIRVRIAVSRPGTAQVERQRQRHPSPLVLPRPVPLQHFIGPVPNIPHPARPIECRRQQLVRAVGRENQRRHQAPVRLERPDQPTEPMRVDRVTARRSRLKRVHIATSI